MIGNREQVSEIWFRLSTFHYGASHSLRKTITFSFYLLSDRYHMEKSAGINHHQLQAPHEDFPQTPAPAYTEAPPTFPSSSRQPSSSTRKKPIPSPPQHKPLPIPYQPPTPAMSSAYPPQELYPNPHTTRSGQHDYTQAYNNDYTYTSTQQTPTPAIDDSYTAANNQDTSSSSAEEPATGPTKGVGVPQSYNAFISFPLLSPWYPSTTNIRPNDYYDPKVSGPRSYPPPLATRGLTESRLMQIQHFACSIRADSQRNKGLLCCGLGVLLGGLGCVLIDNKCVGNTPLRDKVNRWAFENVNPRLEHEGVDVRFAYQKGQLRAYFKDQ
ncbi:hypothetical protein A4X13_0g3322 [Tilletia indica]|uniref:Uncharacterized protein n=1 Tax=Tilletia indica TaxID=43049 RepID=A0A177TYC9_9BASI|nr:hypothetical protein A4X13_0g3322 [Tilletia indica]